ncbi:MAG: hypothetical protein JNL73_04000 [Anaerolineales bacterium]|nr:hypothetical protein [Anaerolineales bacterium]
MGQKSKDAPEGKNQHELEVSLTVQKRLTSFRGRLPSKWLLVLALIVLARLLPELWQVVQSVWALVGWP